MKILKQFLVISGLQVCLLMTTNAQTIIPQEAKVILQDTLAADTSPIVDDVIPTANVEEVRERLREIQKKMTMPVVYNASVHSFVDFFIWKKPSFTKQMLERKNFYFPIFEKYLRKYGMPDELKYLSMIESALNPKAVSRCRAIGLWQFMPVTGREMGLQINEYVDERMSIEKSTEAACKYMRQLYDIFGDWELALAAYNSGPGTVRRALRKAGGETSYWNLHPYLPRDTRSYVPQWTAIIYMMHHADSYGIYPEMIENEVPSQIVSIDGFFNLESFSNASGISLDEIQKLNPHILREYLPAYTRNFELRIPDEKYSYFVANQKMILDSAGKQPIIKGLILAQPVIAESGVITIGSNNNVIASNSQEVASEEKESNDKSTDDSKRIHKVKKKTYTVKHGDILNRIAEKYDVDVYDLKVWNHLKSTNIHPGQKLAILIDNDDATEIERTIKSEKIAKIQAERDKPKIHVVHHGDTLWSIAQRYGGMPIERLKKLNGLRSNHVKTGQKLKLG